jgi:hypothetical protein
MFGIAILLAGGSLAAEAASTQTVHAPVGLYDRPLESKFLHYSRGRLVDTIHSGERITIKETRVVKTALGPQTWYRVARQTGKHQTGWIESSELESGVKRAHQVAPGVKH